MLGNLTDSPAGTNLPPTLDHLSPVVGRGGLIGSHLLSLSFNWPENLSLRSRWLSPCLAALSLVGRLSGHHTSLSHPIFSALLLPSYLLPSLFLPLLPSFLLSRHCLGAMVSGIACPFSTYLINNRHPSYRCHLLCGAPLGRHRYTPDLLTKLGPFHR